MIETQLTKLLQTLLTTNSYNNHIKPSDNYIDVRQQVRLTSKTQVKRNSYINPIEVHAISVNIEVANKTK